MYFHNIWAGTFDGSKKLFYRLIFAYQKEGNPKIHLDRNRVYRGDSTAEIKIGSGAWIPDRAIVSGFQFKPS